MKDINKIRIRHTSNANLKTLCKEATHFYRKNMSMKLLLGSGKH